MLFGTYTVLPQNFQNCGPITDQKFTPKELGYSLFWEDSFNGNHLDKSKWFVRGVGARRVGFNGIEGENIIVKNGKLNILCTTKKDSFFVGAVATQGLFETTYGYFECRAKLPHSFGPWAAFWLQSPQIAKGDDPAKYGTEIDIFEYFLKYGKEIITHAYWYNYGPNLKGYGPLKSKVKNLHKGYHTFALEWTPEKYVFYVDGLKYHEVKEAISHVNEYIILSFEPVGTIEEFKKADLPDTFKIDYVKVYKKDN